MSDDQLRVEAENLIDQIIVRLKPDLPDHFELGKLRVSVLNEAVGLGPLERFIEDDSITEIMVNNHREIFVERAGKLVKSGESFSSDQAVLSVIERIITPLGRRIDESSPMVDARLKDGSRVNAIIPPLAIKGPSLTIRKFAKQRLTFNDIIKYGSISHAMVDFLKICVEQRKNIIVSGGTGSGKTTLLNVLSNFIPDSERIITVEDAA
ncbi:MAG: ATPase, T2SS/T4P/T4SS family, partial [Candidatus Thiodiazotropha sp.]